jgi:prolipoprotein diacylglyceryltransferase
MYPSLYDFFKDVFGVDWRGLRILNSFGFFVALSFIAAAWALTAELKRKQRQGLFTYTEQQVTVGQPASISELLINFVLGFIMGSKIIGGFFMPNAFDDPQAYIFSSQGSWPLGILIGGAFAFMKWSEKHKQKLPKPEQRTIRVWPHDRVGDMVIYAAIFGFSGAKLFDILESPSSFFSLLEDVKAGKQDISSLVFSGLTFYGGLIVATIAIAYYAKKNKIGVIHLADAIAPAMMLAYALGRVGCQVAGDGDWGVVNSAYVSTTDGHTMAATSQQFAEAVQVHANYVVHKFGALENLQHHSVKGFLGLPNWFFAYTYPHNVVGDGVVFAGCQGPHCSYLPLPVFPTPLYEILMCSILFMVLWRMRKQLKVPGQMASLYLILNGSERFLIEKIRVNATYNLGFKVTQAEIISSLLIVAGAILLWKSKQWFGDKKLSEA